MQIIHAKKKERISLAFKPEPTKMPLNNLLWAHVFNLIENSNKIMIKYK